MKKKTKSTLPSSPTIRAFLVLGTHAQNRTTLDEPGYMQLRDEQARAQACLHSCVAQARSAPCWSPVHYEPSATGSSSPTAKKGNAGESPSAVALY